MSIESVIEELCQQILLPVLEEPRIRLAIEYMEEKEQATVTAQYRGTFRPEDTEDELAYTILKARAESIETAGAPEEGQTQVCIRIAEK